MSRYRFDNLPIPDPDCILLHLDCDLTGCYGSASRGDFQLNNPLIGLILTIPGITHVEVRGYSIRVSKGPLFQWEKIKPILVTTVKNALKLDELVEAAE